ncbi:MAG: 1-(5-phosphoribosyl)-5-[(5-phosphoribosylamino)methylideneamino]imidazole-4-carboxamide isomerase [Candidatus Omnitrophica bacterium]|nr:1-(5-phosphoribosyl)-5-[(5-phosphoribosylamino)methylideneamino]imidazole-4-carboxamide isomerase [Candidatus Omnitrophota bacterium]
MLIIPAIDIKDGCVVRYVQGRFNKKIYSRNPVNTAKHWVKQGARLLHVIDLDGAITGIPKNLNIIKEIVKNIDIPIQFGGGIRSIDLIKSLLNFGIYRIILSTKAIRDKKLLKKVFEEFKERIIVSIDIKDTYILTNGWQTINKKISALEFAYGLKQLGFKQIIYTNVTRDGTLKGPDIRGINEFLKKTNLEIIASGGISSLDDLYKLKSLEKKGLIGVIIGKALYEGRFTLSQALRLN